MGRFGFSVTQGSALLVVVVDSEDDYDAVPDAATTCVQPLERRATSQCSS